MPNAQSLAIILFCILGVCIFLALGAFAGSKITHGKLVIFSGALAMVATLFYAVFSAAYFLSHTL